MYHQQQGSQPFPNAARPPHHQPNASQHPNHPNMQGMGFQFPRPNQLPDELESALAVRGSRDVDHRQMDHMNPSNQHQNQGSGAGMGQHGGYGSQPMLLPAENQPGHQQGVDWSDYQPPASLFAPTQQQQPQSSQEGSRLANWNPAISDSQPRRSLGDGGRVEGQGPYTPESAGSILASFGLSNDDLEVLSHYPDDQLTPDTLPFILRDIQLNKSGKKSSGPSAASSLFPLSAPPARPSQPAEVPSLLTGVSKVIDYGHASRGTEDGGTRETFKREPLSVKMFPSSSSSSASKVDKTERRQIRVEHKEPSKHGDRDYRRTSCEKRKSSRSPGREFAPLPKSHNLDRDYRRVESKQRPASETRSEASSRRSLSSSSASRQQDGSKKFPTPTMMSDFSAMPPKVYPHTCSLCHIQCDQEKDWVSHINTVDHTAACRDLRNRYPDWKPSLPSRSGRYGNRAPWDPKDGSLSRSRSRSPASSQGKYRREPYVHRPHGRTFSPDRPSRPHFHSEHSRRFEHHSGPHYSHRTAFLSRDSWPDRRRREPSGDHSHHGEKRPHVEVSKSPDDASSNPPSSEVGHGSKHGPAKAASKSTKAATKPAAKAPKTVVKSLMVEKKKKKKVEAPSSQSISFADRLVFLTGIPADATEQEVTELVGSFGKINNVILLPRSEEDTERGEDQQASVCMLKAEDAQALASAAKLCIRDQEITASIAKPPADMLLSELNSKPGAEQDQDSAGNVPGETEPSASDQDWKVLITGLPDGGWSKSDIVQFVQSFGTPSDIIVATGIGKALVSFPDQDVAEEMVKVHNFKPALFMNTEVKMSVVKRSIGLSTPVALYNLLMGSSEPSEGPALVGWKHLVVVRNVPDPGSAEVLRLVRRFGTVTKSLVVNDMIVCEMATMAMALSVCKRFLMFPCIIQNNPLIFYHYCGIPASCDTPEDKPAEESQAAEPLQEDQEPQEDTSEAPPQNEQEKDEGNLLERKDEGEEEEEELSLPVPASDSKQDGSDEDHGNVSKAASELDVVDKEAPAADAQSVSMETAMPELPKMTQAMVNALLVECRTRTANNLNRTAAPPAGDQGEAKQDQEEPADDTKDPAVDRDEEVKKLDRERKEREAKKERRERERKEKERRERDGERGEKVRREEERKERNRRERRRGYDERPSGSKSSYRQRWREEAERRKDEEEEEEFPFNLTHFVTVDELGDVTDLPDPAVVIETLERGDAAPAEETVSMETSEAQEAEAAESEPSAQTSNGLESGPDSSAGEPPHSDSEGQPGAPMDPGTTSLHAEPGSSSTAALPAQSGPNSTAAAEEEGGAEVQADEPMEESDKQLQETDGEPEPPAVVEQQVALQTENPESAEDDPRKQSVKAALPPYDPATAVGMEYLVPKTGFFCKVCRRVFTGTKVAEISHCKTLKHYENLQKFLQNPESSAPL